MITSEFAYFGIIAVTAYISYRGFQDFSIIQKLIFDVGAILGQRDYIRLVSSGFIHADWNHLIFNMITLYFFSNGLVEVMGVSLYLVLYLVSLVGGNLFALFMHKGNRNYRALGASGAVSGLVFAAIAMFPGMNIYFFLIPIPIPAWVYGLLFVLYSIYGIRSKSDNIGHEAHLGGGVVGLLLVLAIYPNLIMDNTLPIALILIPTLIFMLIIRFKPELLNLKN